MAERLNLRPSERRLLVGVALVLFVVINIWFVWPHFGDLQKAQAKRNTALKKLALYHAEIGKEAERQAAVTRLESAGSNVARQDQAVELQLAIQKTASAHGVVPSGQSRPTTRTNEFFVEQSQNVTMLTSELQLINILYDLGAGNSTIRVRDLTIRPDAPRFNLASSIKLVSSYRVNVPAGRKKSPPPNTAKK